MGRSSNQLLVILAVVLYLFCSSLVKVIGADHNHIPANRKHEDGRRMLQGLAGTLIRGARTVFKNTPRVFQKLKDAFKKADPVDVAQQATEFYLENGQRKNFTEDEAIDYLNCQCECPSFQLDGACVQEANNSTCTAPQHLYCSYFQDNPLPLKCLNCSLIPPPPTAPSVPSSASPISDFIDTLLMMISTTTSIIILVINFS